MDTHDIAEINRLFGVFQRNVAYDLTHTLSPTPQVLDFSAKFEKELGDFHAAVLSEIKRITKS